MSYRDRKKSKRLKLDKGYSRLHHVSEESLVSAEKIRARELRNSSWWKKKISYGECYYCRGKFNPRELTMDHKIPISRGGRSEKINLVPACKECNNKKKYLLPLEWEEYIKSIINPEGDKLDDGR